MQILVSPTLHFTRVLSLLNHTFMYVYLTNLYRVDDDRIKRKNSNKSETQKPNLERESLKISTKVYQYIGMYDCVHCIIEVLP